MMAYHLALGSGHAALAELLHPDIPYTFIFSNDDLQVGFGVIVGGGGGWGWPEGSPNVQLDVQQ
jgi:hypothetical protein